MKRFGFNQQDHGVDSKAEDWVLVHADKAKEFLQGGQSGDHALLWVPDDWGQEVPDNLTSEFHAVIHDGDTEDEKYLERIEVCDQVTKWRDLVEEVPIDWFNDLRKRPVDLFIGEMPFADAHLEHLLTCGACQEEVQLCLEHRLTRRRMLLCPNTDDVGFWLRTGPNTAMESHLKSCWQCQELIVRMASLYAGGGVIAQLGRRAKLKTIGLSDALLEGRPRQTLPIATSMKAFAGWVASAFSHAGTGMLLASSLRHSGSRTQPGDMGPPPPVEVTPEDIEMSIKTNGWVQLCSGKGAIHVSIEGSQVLIRAGQSPSQMFDRFEVRFTDGDEEVVVAKATDGKATLGETEYKTLATRSVTGIEIRP